MEDSFAEVPQVAVNWFTAVFGQNPSWDILLLVVAVGLVVLIAFWGRHILSSVMVASYMTIAIFFMTDIGTWLFESAGIPFTAWGAGITIVALVAIIFSIVNYALGDLFADDPGQFASSLVLALAIVGMMVAFLLRVLPLDIASNFSPLTQSLFTGGAALVVWFFAPLIIVGATRD